MSLNLYAYCEGNPIMYDDPTGHKAGDVFKTQNVAAIDFAKIYATEKDSVKFNYEWFAYIYKKPDGTYSYTNPVNNKGQNNNTDWQPPSYDGKYDETSYIHTHGAYDQLSDLTFSDKDTFGCLFEPIYLANAAGEVLYYNPEGHGAFQPQMYLIAKGLPKLSNVKKGDSGYDPYVYKTIKYSSKNTWKFWKWGTTETIEKGQKYKINDKNNVMR